MARDLDIDGRNTMDREQPNEAITAGELMSRSTTLREQRSDDGRAALD